MISEEVEAESVEQDLLIYFIDIKKLITECIEKAFGCYVKMWYMGNYMVVLEPSIQILLGMSQFASRLFTKKERKLRLKQ